MSDYVPKVGDIVNVTLRDARVVAVRNHEHYGRHVTVRGNDNGHEREFFDCGSGTVAVELVKAAEPPKPKWPTTPGSIIGYKHVDSKYVRLPSGKWLSLRYGDDSGTDDDFSGVEYEVLYDAGAPR